MGIMKMLSRGMGRTPPVEPVKNRKYRRGKGEKKLATNGISSAEFDDYIRIVTLQKYTARWEAIKLRKEENENRNRNIDEDQKQGIEAND